MEPTIDDLDVTFADGPKEAGMLLGAADNAEHGYDVREDAHAWQPQTNEDVDWILEVLRQQTEHATRQVAILDKRIADLQHIRQKYLDRVSRAEGFWHPKLEDWYRRWRAEFPKVKTKTVEFANGKLSARKTGANVAYTEDEIIAWANANKRLDLLSAKVSVSKTSLKQAVLEDGESIPGVEIIPEGENVTVTVAK